MAKNRKIVVTKEEKSELIRLWEGEEGLYVPDHNDYHDINKRTASLKRIASEMTIEIDHNQVLKTS